MKMPDGEEYEFDGNEVVSIEEGLMFLDEPAEGSGMGASGPDDAALPADAPPAAGAEPNSAVPQPPVAEKKDQ